VRVEEGVGFYDFGAETALRAGFELGFCAGGYTGVGGVSWEILKRDWGAGVLRSAIELVTYSFLNIVVVLRGLLGSCRCCRNVS
jgi:hypothetical protein